jgi:ornithine cyclodeaminase
MSEPGALHDLRVIDAAEVHAGLPYPALIDRLEAAFASGQRPPPRHHHAIPVAGEPDATLLLMPAWRSGGAIGLKTVTVFPGNGRRGLPAVLGTYILLDGASGRPRALIDGQALTVRRTAAASALASRFLSRPDSHRLVMVGAGALAPHLVRAHSSVRPIAQVTVWNHRPRRAEELAESLRAEGLAATASRDLETAVRAADLVSCATLSTAPLVRGEWLSPGTHLDLVGGFTPQMREADDEALARAAVWVDTFEGALTEPGDILGPLASGALRRDDIRGDLYGLAAGTTRVRQDDEEITLFKSVGTALEDLAAAELLLELRPLA